MLKIDKKGPEALTSPMKTILLFIYLKIASVVQLVRKEYVE